jgi:hypothetical protein
VGVSTGAGEDSGDGTGSSSGSGSSLSGLEIGTSHLAERSLLWQGSFPVHSPVETLPPASSELPTLDMYGDTNSTTIGNSGAKTDNSNVGNERLAFSTFAKPSK